VPLRVVIAPSIAPFRRDRRACSPMKTIKDMPEHSRPREKLRERGACALTDEELVAAILGMGTAGVDVRTIARQVAGLIREHKTALTLEHLLAVPGVGLAKAGQILSAFELARRHLLKDTVKLTTASDALPLLADIAGKQQEHFLCISLNGANEVIEKRTVTIGLLDRSQVHPREVFADVIADRAAAVIFAHNHPSGQSPATPTSPFTSNSAKPPRFSAFAFSTTSSSRRPATTAISKRD
jgi:DNA repair protein RadC